MLTRQGQGTTGLTARSAWLQKAAQGVGSLGPYLLVELLLPGGSLVALAMWLLRNRASLKLRS